MIPLLMSVVRTVICTVSSASGLVVGAYVTTSPTTGEPGTCLALDLRERPVEVCDQAVNLVEFDTGHVWLASICTSAMMLRVSGWYLDMSEARRNA